MTFMVPGRGTWLKQNKCNCSFCEGRSFKPGSVPGWPAILYGHVDSGACIIHDIPMFRSYGYPGNCQGCIHPDPNSATYFSNFVMCHDAGNPGSNDETCCFQVNCTVACVNGNIIPANPLCPGGATVPDNTCFWTAGMDWICGDTVNFALAATNGCVGGSSHYFTSSPIGYDSGLLGDPDRPACIRAREELYSFSITESTIGGGASPEACTYGCCQEYPLPTILYAQWGDPCPSLGFLTQLFAAGTNQWVGFTTWPGCDFPIKVTYQKMGCHDLGIDCNDILLIDIGGETCMNMGKSYAAPYCFPIEFPVTAWNAHTGTRCACACPDATMFSATVMP